MRWAAAPRGGGGAPPTHGMHCVGEGLEVLGGGGDALLGAVLAGVGVEAVGEVAAAGQVQAHDAVVRLEQGGVGGEVGGAPCASGGRRGRRRVRRDGRPQPCPPPARRRTRVRLDVDAPGLSIQAVGGEGALLAKALHLVDELIPAVVPLAWQALGVLVGEAGAQALEHGTRGEVLRQNQGRVAARVKVTAGAAATGQWIAPRTRSAPGRTTGGTSRAP